MKDEFGVVICGVGGQGSILSSHIVGEAAIKDGYHVRVAETYGAAMRGGAVMGQIRIGRHVQEPLIRSGRSDAVVALEPLEALRRGVYYLGHSSVILLNTHQLPPIDVNLGRATYPPLDTILDLLRPLAREVIAVDATSLAKKAGSNRVLNVVMIGTLKGTGVFPVTEESLREAISERVPAGTQDLNLKAFEYGIEAVQNSRSN
jgi:indolepyruvate ferredoxin oxidoreductase beta subunit